MNPTRRLRQSYRRLDNFLNKDLWNLELDDLSFPRSGFYHALRVVYLLFRGFIKERTMMRSATLTLGTLLTIIPLLAFIFAIAQGLGIQETLQPRLVGMLIPEGIAEIQSTNGGREEPVVEEEGEVSEASAEREELLRLMRKMFDPETIEDLTEAATDYYTRNTQAKALGSAALLILLLIVLRIMGHVEAAMNEIWGVAKPRSFLRKLTDYLSILIIGPLVFAAVMTVNIGVDFGLSVPFGAQLQDFATKFFLMVVPYLVYWIFLTAFYIIIPNTKVNTAPALLGGLAAGVLLQLLQLFYVRFQVTLSSYSEIYGVFAAVPIFLIWLNLTWLVILFGAHLAFAIQNVRTYEHETHLKHITEADREAIALQLMAQVAHHFEEGLEPPTPAKLAESSDLPLSLVNHLTYALQEAGILKTVETPEGGLILARPSGKIRVGDILDVIRGERTESQSGVVEKVMDQISEAMAKVSHHMTLTELAHDETPAEPSGDK